MITTIFITKFIYGKNYEVAIEIKQLSYFIPKRDTRPTQSMFKAVLITYGN